MSALTRFTDLPREIRNLIYYELASFRKNTNFEIGTTPSWYVANQRWSLPTYEILTVNKQFSREVLECFNKEQTLVLLRTNEDQFLKHFACKIIPMKFVHQDLGTTLDLPLKIELVKVQGYTGLEDDPHHTSAIIPSRYLPTLVQLLNSYDSILRFKGVDAWFSFNQLCLRKGFNRLILTFSPRCREDVVEKLVQGLGGIRRPRRQRLQGMILWWPPEEPILGVFSNKGISPLPPLSEEECIEMAKSLKEQGDVLAKRGECIDARKDYTLAITMLGRGRNALFPPFSREGRSSWDPYGFKHRLPIEAFTLLINLYSSLERVSTKLNLDIEPRRLSRVRLILLEHYGKKAGGQFIEYTEEEKISTIKSHYQNAMEDGNFSVAGNTLKFGTREFPENVELELLLAAFPDACAQYFLENNTNIRGLPAKETAA